MTTLTSTHSGEIKPSEIKPREIKLEPGWKAVLEDEFAEEYMLKLKAFLQSEIKVGKTIYPRPSEYFNAFNHTPFDKVKAVILGQDPYHGPGQAHGLAFSVRPGVKVPPSLLNIYKELKTDVGFEQPDHGYLMPWADQGVLMLNSVLTVEAGLAGSHQKKGWETFTDKAIEALSIERKNVVFILWGSYAQKKGAVIDRKKHLVLEGPHPSPLSASRGFFGSRPFSKINSYLRKHELSEINWQLPFIALTAILILAPSVFAVGDTDSDLAADKSKTTVWEVKQKASETVDTAARYAKESKADFAKRMQNNISDAQKNINELRNKANKSAGQGQAKINAQIEDLELKRDGMQKRLNDLQKSSGRAWSHLKEGVAKAWGNVKDSTNEAVDEFKTGQKLNE